MFNSLKKFFKNLFILPKYSFPLELMLRLIGWHTTKELTKITKMITPEFLQEKKVKLVTDEKYIRWLKRSLWTLELAKKKEMKELIKDVCLEEAIKLLKDELDKYENKHYSG